MCVRSPPSSTGGGVPNRGLVAFAIESASDFARSAESRPRSEHPADASTKLTPSQNTGFNHRRMDHLPVLQETQLLHEPDRMRPVQTTEERFCPPACPLVL